MSMVAINAIFTPFLGMDQLHGGGVVVLREGINVLIAG